jgi:hypothetical protein
VRIANLALKFLLELAAFAGFAYWGWRVGSGVVAVLLAVAAPAVMIAVWGLFAAPRSTRRLGTSARIPLELGVFALAAVALAVAGRLVLALVFGVLVVANALLLTAFRQWEE